ncbi:MAG: hypothetical protein ACTSR8_01705 [Promethearchaeota archaeon]
MDDANLMVQINQLKNQVSDIILTIQRTKKKLEIGEISLLDFKFQKEQMEDKLRAILQQISELKKKEGTSHKINYETPPEITVIKTEDSLKSEILKQTPLLPEDIDKEIMIAGEAKDLMYYFQTEFENSITNAKIYISVTIDVHFIIGLDYSNYPGKPLLEFPSELLKEYDNNSSKILDRLEILELWDKEEPARLYELIQELESILINKYESDLQTLEEKSYEYIQDTRQKMYAKIKLAKQEKKEGRLANVLKVYYAIVELAQDCQEYDLAKEYTAKISEIQKKMYNK